MAEIREPSEQDIDALIAVKDAATADWGPDRATPGSDRHRAQRELFRHLLRTGSALAAFEGGEPVGFGNAIVREDVWFLSQLFVRPDTQSAGAGASILDGLLARPEAAAARVRAVLSSSDARALSLYFSRGMLPEWLMVQFVRTVPRRVEPEPARLEPITEDDQPALDALDREVRGFARTVDHAFLRAISAGHVVRREGRVVAYVYVHPNGRVSPLVAADPGSLVGAVDAADAIAGPDAEWSAASSSPVLVRRLLGLGYRPGWLTTFCADGPVGPFDRIALAGGAFL
jgi:hypothetical protein